MTAPLDELGILRRWLGDLRGTVERKAEGLSPEQLAGPFGAAIGAVGAGAAPRGDRRRDRRMISRT